MRPTDRLEYARCLQKLIDDYQYILGFVFAFASALSEQEQQTILDLLDELEHPDNASRKAHPLTTAFEQLLNE